jgi:hypothetical protein
MSQSKANGIVQKAAVQVQKADANLDLAIDLLRRAAAALGASELLLNQAHDTLQPLYNTTAEGASEDARALPYYLGESLAEDVAYSVSLLKSQVVQMLKNNDISYAQNTMAAITESTQRLVQVAAEGWQHTDEPLELGA